MLVLKEKAMLACLPNPNNASLCYTPIPIWKMSLEKC